MRIAAWQKNFYQVEYFLVTRDTRITFVVSILKSFGSFISYVDDVLRIFTFYLFRVLRALGFNSICSICLLCAGQRCLIQFVSMFFQQFFGCINYEPPAHTRAQCTVHTQTFNTCRNSLTKRELIFIYTICRQILNSLAEHKIPYLPLRAAHTIPHACIRYFCLAFWIFRYDNI